MNSNSFLSSNSNLQPNVANDRLKSFFKPSSSVSNVNSQQAFNEQLRVDFSRGESSGRQVFSKSIEFSLGVKVESSYEFKIPSPKEVASTVLGFVENRINAERSSGASNERLDNLMSQAKSGIEKGYAQAEKDIKDLGLMTDELSEDIAEGFSLINQGLDKIKQGIEGDLAGSAALAENSVSEKDKSQDKPVTSSENIAIPNTPPVNSQQPSNIFDRLETKDIAQELNANSLKASVSVKQLTENTADFVLNTREGDQVLIRMSDLQTLAYQNSNKGESLDFSQSSGFEFSVKGDLNEQELLAINNMLEQVGDISALFFSDQFDEAFSSALNLGFDSSQIASFALDLSKLQVQEIRTYEEGPRNAMDSYKRNQPLINMAQQFESLDTLIQPLERFEKINSMIEALVFKAIERYSFAENKEESKAENKMNNFQEFSKKLLDEVF